MPPDPDALMRDLIDTQANRRRGFSAPRKDMHMTELKDLDHEHQHFTQATVALAHNSTSMRRVAALIAAVGVVGLAVAAVTGWLATAEGLREIAGAEKNVTQILIFELVRTTAGAALLGAFAWGTLNLSRAALDQGTRYDKRFIAGHFLVYVVRKFESEIKSGKIGLADVMSVFKAWSDSVDSAFTSVKFGSKNNQSLSISAGKDGWSISSGGSRPVRIASQAEASTD